VLTADIFDSIRGVQAGIGEEIQLADAINFHAKNGEVECVRLNGRRFDCGSVLGFMQASSYEFEKRLGV
jgi:UTP--glucose-1-phosphate uridylyltransferase